MITLTIDDKSRLGQQITSRAHAAGIGPIALIHGITYEALSRHQDTLPAAPAPAPAAVQPAPAAAPAAPAADIPPAPSMGLFKDTAPAAAPAPAIA